jgi:formate hydrogenlyase subunit 3/multisubunit Na+/H+ antiporter MnhD subunit
MSAPVLWIAVPMIVGVVTLLLFHTRAIALAGAATCLALALIALAIPIDEALRIGPVSFKIASTASLLGRSFVVPAPEAPLLVMLFGLCAVWFLGAEVAGVAQRLVPVGLIIVGLLIASIAVQPFLYAALLIELAALAAVPLLVGSTEKPGHGVVRFIIYQTLGMPCILFAGWLLAGVETSPGNLSLTVQATVMLGLGFAFVLAVFPLNEWIPSLMEQANPFIAGFLLWLLPSIVVVFGMSFLDGYAWLRASPQIVSGLRILGLVMLVSSGLWSIFERHMGRLMVHAVIAGTGMMFLAGSLAATSASATIFSLFIPRGVGIGLWAMALATLKARHSAITFDSLGGAARSLPWASAGLIVAALSAAGFPLLAGFPPRLDVWIELAKVPGATATWVFVGLAGVMIGALRQLAVLLAAGGENPWKSMETRAERGLFGAGMLALMILGLFPRGADFVVGRLPLMFEHLGR